MSVYFRNFYSTTPCQKYATAGLISALATFAIGFCTAMWTGVIVFHKDINDRIFEMIGLWQICSCVFSLYESSCDCKERTGDPVWLTATQVLVTIALVGLFISGFISTHQLLLKRNRRWKRLNIYIQVLAGVLGICGVTVYGIGAKVDPENVDYFFEKHIYKDYILHVSIEFSYYFCCTSIGLIYVVSVPLFIIDERILERGKRKPQARHNDRVRPGVQNNVRSTPIATGTPIATVTKDGMTDISELPPITAVKDELPS